VRTAAAEDAAAIHALIVDHLDEGHLLPRELAEIQRHVHRFVVAVRGGLVLGCAELAPLSHSVAEVRSLVVHRAARSGRVGRRLVDELLRRAEGSGYETLCAFTHAPAYFVRLGFSLAPHISLPEKITADCGSCPQFRRCGQYAVVRTFGAPRRAGAPQALHG
jgi:N-acetylglutamate synthase-like GNAT family acetyltransferase